MQFQVDFAHGCISLSALGMEKHLEPILQNFWEAEIWQIES